MVRPIQEFLSNHHQYHHLFYSAPLAAIGLFLAITALVALCAQHNHSNSSKIKTTTAPATTSSKPKQLQAHDSNVNYNHNSTSVADNITDGQRAEFTQNTAVPLRSPLRSTLMSPLRTQRFFTELSDKATILFSTADQKKMPRSGSTHNMVRRASHYDKRLEAAFYDGFTSDDEEDDLKGNEDEDRAVWQKNILMGDKCRPLEFSGVIYYDDCGNKLAQIPRLPRAAVPTPSPQRSFTFPGSKDCV